MYYRTTKKGQIKISNRLEEAIIHYKGEGKSSIKKSETLEENPNYEFYDELFEEEKGSLLYKFFNQEIPYYKCKR